MNDKVTKYKELLYDLGATVEHARVFDETADDVVINDMISELRQMIERLRRLKDGESLTYEPVKQEEPKI